MDYASLDRNTDFLRHFRSYSRKGTAVFLWCCIDGNSCPKTPDFPGKKWYGKSVSFRPSGKRRQGLERSSYYKVSRIVYMYVYRSGGQIMLSPSLPLHHQQTKQPRRKAPSTHVVALHHQSRLVNIMLSIGVLSQKWHYFNSITIRSRHFGLCVMRPCKRQWPVNPLSLGNRVKSRWQGALQTPRKQLSSHLTSLNKTAGLMAARAIKQTRWVHNNKKHISQRLRSSGLLTSNRHNLQERVAFPLSISLSAGARAPKKHLSHTLYCLIACWLLLQSNKLMAWFSTDIRLCSFSVMDVLD